MKILMVCKPSIHFFRWTEHLEGFGYEFYWFDLNSSGVKSDRISWVDQFVNWRFKWDFPLRYIVKSRLPKLYKYIKKINDRDLTRSFEEVLIKVKPDVVHSFVLYSGCAPIFDVMVRHQEIKWMYSAWGNDLFYYQNIPMYLTDIKKVLPQIDFMFADNKRDFEIAKKYGFKGISLGDYPGGGGYHIEKFSNYTVPVLERKIILVKGYQLGFGRCINVLKALLNLKNELENFKVVVFAADKMVQEFVQKNGAYQFVNIEAELAHAEVLKLMGNAYIYIGNAISDGMPNTLLEAIIMGAFPIQSNPGGVTEEILQDNVDGLLIQDPENLEEIEEKIRFALSNAVLIKNAHELNINKRKQLSFNTIRNEVLKKYDVVNNAINESIFYKNNVVINENET